MSSIINNSNNYEYEIESDVDSRFFNLDCTRLVEFAREHNYKFNASELNWSQMCKSNSMDTMKFLDENKPWICWGTIMNNSSDEAWWLIERALNDTNDKTKEIWNIISSTKTAIAKKLCELHPEHIVWDELSRNRAEWAIEIMNKKFKKQTGTLTISEKK